MLVFKDIAEEAEAQVPTQGDDVQEPAAEEVVTEVAPPTPTLPSPPSPVIPSLPPHQPPCPPQPQDAEVPSILFQQQLEIVKLKARVKKLEKINMVKSSKLRRLKKVGTSQRVESSDDMENVFNHGRKIADMDQDEGIELFWNTAVVKRSGDVTRLQALVDKKRIVITEEVVREILVKGLENDKAAQQLEIVKLKARVKKLEKINMVKSSKLRRLKKVRTSQRVKSSDDMENVFNQGRIIADMDQDEGIELVADLEKDAEVEGRHADKQAELYNLDLEHSSKVLSMQEDDTEVQKAIEIVTTAKLMTEVVTAAVTQAVAASTPIPAAKPKILNIVAAPVVSTRRRKGVVIRDPEEELPSETAAETPKVKDKGKGILIESPKPMKKKDQIEMDAEYAKKLQEEINKEHEETYKNIDWNAALDHVQSKEPQYIKRYHGMKKKPQTEFEARKNMIFYLKNTEGYKMDFFKGMKYDEILLIFQAKFDANMRFLFKSREEMEEKDEEIIKSINETPA
nr:hypothetical protein [Tanacetum cinerariifolium]